jgi:hypothetical protein
MQRFKNTLDAMRLRELNLSGRRFTWSNEQDSPTRACGVVCSSDLPRSGRFSYLFAWFHVSLFHYTMIGDGCFSNVSLFLTLSTTTSCLFTTTISTTTSLAGSGDVGAGTVACLRLMLVFVVVARWSNYLFVVLILFWAISTVDDY